MNLFPLPERDRRGCEDAFNLGQRGKTQGAVDRAVIAALALAGGVSLATEGVIGYHVFSGLFAPDVPGDPANGPAGVMALSTVLAAAAFHLYLLRNPNALAGRLLDKSVPWLALGFICTMALMAVRSVLDATGVSLFGNEAPPPGLFTDEQAAPETSLFDRFVTAAFGFGLAGLAVCNFWLTQKIGDLLWNRLKPMTERRVLTSETKALMGAVNEDEARLGKLGAERQMLLRELEPEASLSFATDLAALLQQLRGPVVGVITGHHIWKKRSASVVERQDEPELDIGKFKELAAALDLDREKIFAAFNGSHEGKKK